MKFVVLIVLAYLAESSADRPGGVPIENLPYNPKIIGGEEASPHQYPHQVHLKTHRANGAAECGGTIIRADVILTAAHCVDNAFYIEVSAGVHNLSENEPHRQVLISTNYIIHEEWDKVKLLNDLAIIFLPIPLTLDGSTAKAISLRYGGCPDTVVAGLPATISGWGKQFNDSINGVPVLRHVSSTIMTPVACAAVYRQGMIVDSQICLSGLGIKGGCDGDSGGPMIISTSGGGLQLVGIASFVSSAGCEEQHPSVYTRVSCFTSWIYSKIH